MKCSPAYKIFSWLIFCAHCFSAFHSGTNWVVICLYCILLRTSSVLEHMSIEKSEIPNNHNGTYSSGGIHAIVNTVQKMHFILEQCSDYEH